MSGIICDVSTIQNEDVLRQMWQDTEDFGRKKEIRAHMYKVREARLKDLYSSGGTESQTNVQKTSSSKSSNIQTTHADSLADHSFASLKSKEVRDSESPTRDVAFNNKINATEKYGHKGWTITSAEDSSKDGKTHTAVRTATTSGSEKIDKGTSNYAAKAEQKSSVYQDGDANNFNRTVGVRDSSTIHQEASGGDEFSSFKTSSTSSKSGSKTVMESKSQSGDMVDYICPKNIQVKEMTVGNQDLIPTNAKTVVYTETKILPDGNKVTTTRYETRGGSSKSTTSGSQSSTVQKMSGSTQQSASTSSEQRSSSKYITGSTQDDRHRHSIADGGVDTVDYKKELKLSEDFSKNVAEQTSNKTTSSKTEQQQQEIVKASKHAEVSSSTKQHDTKVLETRTTHQDIVDKQICEVKTSQPAATIRTESTPPKRPEESPITELREQPPTTSRQEPYEQPERRQPFKQAKSELEVSSKATEGQYDTTYRSEFTNKKIHVEVSPTHDAFARSLRALTPEDLKQGSSRSLRNSNTSLRSSQSPEKMRHPSKVSPDRQYSPKRYTSQDKCYETRTTNKYSPEKVTSYNTDTVTRRRKVTEDVATYRSTTSTRATSITKERVKSRSRSASPTTIKIKSPQVTDLDDDNTTICKSTTKSTKFVSEVSDSRPTTLNYSKKSKKITERSPTSPLVDLTPSKRTPSPASEVIRRTSLKEEQQQKILRRSDTYEERCRQILGIPEKKKPERDVSDIINTDRRTYRTSSKEKLREQEVATTRKPSLPDAARRPSKSPEKATVNGYHDKKSPQISEFPSQVRRSPERAPVAKYPERQTPSKDKPTISEFPSQIRQSPEKQPLEKYHVRTSPKKEAPKISEFPSQIRRSPVKEPVQKLPKRESPPKEEGPKINDFSSQIRRTPERQPLPEYPEKKVPSKDAPKISEFPSQIRKTPEREQLPEYPEKKVPLKDIPKICEFPSQIRKTPEREQLPEYPEKKVPSKDAPKISEFPSQIRKTPEREPLPEYPEKKVTAKQTPTICEFPAQIRKTPEREPLPQHPEKPKEEATEKLRESPIITTDNIVIATEEILTTKEKTQKLTEFPSQAPKEAPQPTAEDKVLQETIDYLYKDKIPIDEPFFTKKFIAELGSDDECEITIDEEGNTKINTIEDEEVYAQEAENISHETGNKESPEKEFIREKLSQERQDQTMKQQIDEFISVERNDIYRTTESRKSSPDLRKSPERGILKHISQFDEKTQKSEILEKKSTADDTIGTIETEETIKVSTVKTKQRKPPTSSTTTKKHLVRESFDSNLTKTVTKEVKDMKLNPVLSKTPSNKSVALRKQETLTTPRKSSKICSDIKLETINKTSSTDSRVTKKFVQQKPESSVSSKRHVVTTTINVIPRTVKNTTTTREIKNITNTQNVQTKPKQLLPAKLLKSVEMTTKKFDMENIENTEQVTQKKRMDKLVRTNTDQTAAVRSRSKTPTKVTSKPEFNRKTPDVKDNKKCITTKTILINNTVADEREIIVDLLRSTSTRDDQNAVCPIPIKNNDVKGTPRYPDRVTEPDDYTTKCTAARKLSTIPIDECEDVSDFTGVTEITTEDVIKEETLEETADESLLSVNEKVCKFTHPKEKVKILGPAPKVERPTLIIDEKLESDECLLSVSEKVNKFVNKVSLVDIPERPRSPRCQNIVDITDLDENDESLRSVSDKVTHFVTTAENVKKPQTSTIKIERTDLSTVDESLRADECLLSVFDKVSKFITTAETLSTKQDEAAHKKPSSITTKPTKKTTKECVEIEQTYTRTSPQRQTTPKNIDRTSPTRRTSIKEERRNSRKDSSSILTRKESTAITSVTKEIDGTPKTTRPSTTKPILNGSTTPLRSTESIRKAKALFESMVTGTENLEIKRQKDILNRPSVFDATKKTSETVPIRRVTPDRDDVKLKDIGIKESATSMASKAYDTRRKLSFSSAEDESKSTIDYKSTKSLLEKADTSEVDRKYCRRSSSPDDNSDVPGYMKPLDRSLRPNSPHRTSVTDIEQTVNKASVPPEVPTPASKFGVTLRRTDSGKNFIGSATSVTTTERKRSVSSILKNYEIEEIYELDILEELLETTAGYDLRRRIRSQIRLVKILISEDKLKIVNLKSSKVAPETKVYTKKSPTRDVPERRSYNRKSSDTNFTEYQAKQIKKSSTDSKAIDNYLHLVENKDVNNKATEYQTSYSRKSSTTKNHGNTESKPNTRSKSPVMSKSRETSPKPCRKEKSPEKSIKTSSKYFQTELKKVSTSIKSTKDDKPDWVTNRPLRKITDTPTPLNKKYSSSTTKTTVTKEIKSSGGKDFKPTDVITSSYGVGPMDENGSPLFGLKALRTGSIDQSKVQGTVIRSEYYSENGQEPVGEISVTKYSTDPTDLSSDDEVTREDGLLSKTTTQKFGYKGTPSFKSVTDEKQLGEIENENRTKKSTTKVTRRGSVKEMTQKFLDNTVDSLKTERQTYPKAGLILRTSTFKDSSDGGTVDTSPAEERSSTSTVTTVRTSTSKTTSGGGGGGQAATQKGQTFLTNKSKVTGMQDIVSRMQESNKGATEEGDSVEDTEARSLLNKFLGSQVILSGIEGCSSRAATRKATTKITTTITEGGKPRTITCTFTHPISAEDIADISDEETLRLLLDQSSDYDERRVLRARLKIVMAEKEVVANIVEEQTKQSVNSSTTTSESSSMSSMSNQPQQHVQGESLLLPLLQGLLDAPDAAEHDSNKNADSGTECAGDDLRSGLIVEVQSALDKLSACLCSDATDISTERRESLLQLVNKLQANLVTTSQPSSNQSGGRNSERRASGQSRFIKRKQRPSRHTVGVTSEELEDARRLMEEFSLTDVIPLKKQNSESAVQKNVQGAFRPVKFQPYKPLHIKNATAKPFTSSNSSSVSHTPSGASSTVETPTESLDLLFSEYHIKSPPHQSVDQENNKYVYRQSVSLDHSDASQYKKPLHQTMSLDYNNTKEVDLMAIHQAVQQAAATKQSKTNQLEVDSETDEDPSTLKATTPQLNTVDLFHHTIPKAQGDFNNFNQQPDLLLQSNPLFISRDDSASSIDKESRFNNKKLKMKRANTIDIPKPIKCYVDENESEDDESLERKQNSYIQLREPLNVGKSNNGKIVPNFKPKTVSDKKFMAFINRQSSEKAANLMAKTSIWDNHQNDSSVHGASANWNRKFGNIKTTFERGSSTESNTSQAPIGNSARNFWKSTDDAHAAGAISYNGPKISKQSARNLQQMFEEKQKQTQSVPWIAESQNIVKGSLKVDAKIFEQCKNKVPTSCTSVNMFSHAPMSAFKPIQKNQINVVPSTNNKTPTNNIQQNTKAHQSIKSHQSIVESYNTEIPLFLYSPKSFIHESNCSSSVAAAAAATSPTIKQTPWNQTSNESRVRNIAVSKFETFPEPSAITYTAPIINTRKKSTEKCSMPKYLQQSAGDGGQERIPSNYISYNSVTNHHNKPQQQHHQGGSVQKISGKYNNLASERSEPSPMQRHQSAFATVPQSAPKFQANYQQLPYTHSITYSQPKVPYNTQYYSQVDAEVPRSKPEPQKLDQIRIYQEQYNNGYKATPKHEPSSSHIVYNNIHSGAQPTNFNINRQNLIEQDRLYNARNSPNQNGHHHLDYTTYTSQHLPHVETFVSTVSPPQMHYNQPYQRNIEDSVSPIRKIERHFSPPQPQLSKAAPKYESQTSEESLHEYNAVSSRVMTGPVSQQAVNINQNAPKNRNQHDMDAAFNLKSTLQTIDKTRLDKSPTPPKKQTQPTLVKIMPNVMVNDKPLESLEINERGESIVTSKFHIQVKQKPDPRPVQGQALSKSDSWNQICQSANLSTANKPSPRSSPNARTVMTVTKSKSTHTLALPKQFEAGMSRDEMAHKKQTMEAYFAGSKSPKLTSSTGTNKTSTIHRTKTNQKMSVMRQNSGSSCGGGLSRSRTLPDIVCADLLDETNVDEAFADLFKAKSFDSTKKSFTEGPRTTSEVSTTKLLSQQQVSKKPMSPFAKFKQLDRANSLNTPPTTPKTPAGGGSGGGAMFKFTDPQLSRSASTIKERLLHWCQMKTREYENIQLDNFSGSWADGLAFCALIHHFLPDAFDYTKLTPNNRRYNFTLAFQIADEKADIAPLLDVEDMVATRRPDWKCVFTYVQSIYRRFKDED